MQIITPRPEDAQRYWNLLNALDHETEFMMYEPGERTQSLARIEAMLAEAPENMFIRCAEDEGELVGFISAGRGNHLRTQHSAYIVCGIREKYRRQGLGTKFFQLLDEWARAQNIHRLELTVMCENTAALSLYLKSGFEIEGAARHTMRVRGVYKDEYHMSKIYPEEAQAKV